MSYLLMFMMMYFIWSVLMMIMLMFLMMYSLKLMNFIKINNSIYWMW